MDRPLAKQRIKQAVRRTIGEPYVGKRLKLRNLNRAMAALDLDPRTILDAGSEDATFVYWLADRYRMASVTAIDVDAKAVRIAAAARPAAYAARVAFEVRSFDTLGPDQFDLVTAFDVLEHIPDDVGALRNLHRTIRPDGTLLIHVPRNVWTHLDGRKECVPDNEAWRINSGHVRTGYSPESLSSLVTSAGFEVADVQLWLRRWGVIAHETYARIEHVLPLRIATLPLTDVAAFLDRGRPSSEGNTVFLIAFKPPR